MCVFFQPVDIADSKNSGCLPAARGIDAEAGQSDEAESGKIVMHSCAAGFALERQPCYTETENSPDDIRDMSEKDQQQQSVETGQGKPRDTGESARGKAGGGEKSQSRDDRLAEALRANLRRRKSAAKSRKDG